ncbi:hypothetical protein D3C80_1847290 [compost metagenome]
MLRALVPISSHAAITTNTVAPIGSHKFADFFKDQLSKRFSSLEAIKCCTAQLTAAVTIQETSSQDQPSTAAEASGTNARCLPIEVTLLIMASDERAATTR